jgi:hypothetical protein
MKILIFSGIWAFHKFLLGFSVSAKQRCAYNYLTENLLFASQIQMGLSFCWPKAQVVSTSLSCLSWFWALSSNHLLKVNLHLLPAISATLPVCSLHISNRHLNLSCNVIEPHQGSL